MVYRIFSLSILIVAICSIPLSSVHAQDTPEHIREAAIADLNARIPDIGRPIRWQHTLETTQNSNLGCTLLQPGTQLPTPIQVYVVMLYYDNASYIYRISPDASIVIPCDAKLLSTFNTQTQNLCTPEAMIHSYLSIGQEPTVMTSGYVYAEEIASGTIITTLTTGTIVTIVSGPFCSGNQITWEVEYSGGRGYMLEVDYTASQPVYHLQTDPFSPTAVSPLTQPNYAYTSNTCPADFAGYLTPRLQIGTRGQVESGDANNILRQSYGRSSPPTGTEMPPGAVFNVIAGPECTGDGIVWWQVEYNGVLGWTAESQDGEYYLELPTTNPGAADSGFTLENPPTTSLPSTRIPISSGNITQLQQVGQLNFGDYSLNDMSLADNGTIGFSVSHPQQPGATVIVYQSLNAADLHAVGNQWSLLPMERFLGVSPGGDLLALYQGNPQQSSRITFVSTATFTASSELSLPDGATLDDFRVSPAGNITAYTHTTGEFPNAAGRLQFYYPAAGDIRTIYEGTPITRIAFSHNGNRLAGYGTDGTLHIWNTQTFQEQIIFYSDTPGIVELAFSPDGNLLAVGDPLGNVRVYDLNSQTLKFAVIPYQNTQGAEIYTLAFSPDGSILAVGGAVLPLNDNASTPIVVFELTMGNRLASLIGHTATHSLAFSPDGSLLLSQGIHEVIIWAVH